jgi:glycosyltransferase involved in cell wall biosynthesis
MLTPGLAPDMLPLVSVIAIGYDRIDLLKRTITSFLHTTTYPRNSLELILCDDGSPASAQRQMRLLPFDLFLMSAENRGIGHNTNKGIRAATGAYLLHLQDDWECGGPRDFIDVALDLFQERSDVALVRLREPFAGPHESYKMHSGRTAHIYAHRTEWRSTTGEYTYSDTPHIKRRTLHETIGLYREGKPMHKVEMDFCRRFEKQNVAKAAFIDGYSCFRHTGSAASFNPVHTRRPWRTLVQELPGGRHALVRLHEARDALMRRLMSSGSKVR